MPWYFPPRIKLNYSPVQPALQSVVDLRVISAANRGLTREVETGKFRRDLYYRLCALRIARNADPFASLPEGRRDVRIDHKKCGDLFVIRHCFHALSSCALA
jgi:transcriptional regulator of aromatic amino acid metabolism